MSPPPIPLDGVKRLGARFDGFILDQWGVLHDGTAPYPGAQDALARLRASGKRIVILSNSGKRAAPNVALMTRIGFGPDLYDALISAGEDAHRQIKLRRDPFYATLGRRCFTLGRPGDADLFEGLDLEIVDRLERADFVFLIGLDPARPKVDAYDELLREAMERGLPMVCANPDLVRPGPHGLFPAPGMVARRYEELGGKVRYHGKPYRPIYRTCLETLGCADHGRVVAVGDSLEHDVAGASGAEVSSALVAGGIHAAQLGISHGETPSQAAVATLLAAAPARPCFVLPAFIW